MGCPLISPMRRWPSDEKIVGHLVGGGEIVDAHARGLRIEASGRDRHRRHARLLQRGQHVGGFAERRRQDDAGGAAFDQLARGGAFRGGAGEFAFLQNDLGALAARFVERADQELAEIGGAGVAVEQTEARADTSGEAAGGGIGGVIEVLDGGHHRGARRFAHVLLAIDDARHRHRRHPGAPCHIVDRRGAARFFSCLMRDIRQVFDTALSVQMNRGVDSPPPRAIPQP